MKVSFDNYARQNHLIKNDIRRELNRFLSLDSDSEIFGYQYRNEKKIGSRLGPGKAIGTSSGTAALQLSLSALGIGPGDEVITSAHSYIATALSILNTGARPVFVDIDKDTMLMDISRIEDTINPKTRAVLPVHLFGQMCDMNAINKIAKKHRLAVVEDACQAHLARFDGKRPGQMSDAACYSFFPSKNLSSAGNGGMVTTRSAKLRDIIEILRNPSSENPLLLRSRRTPAYMDGIAMAFILARIDYLEQWTSGRREIAQGYDEGLKGLPLILPSASDRAFHVYRNYVVRTPERDRLMRHLGRKGIASAIHYRKPIHLNRALAHLGYRKGDFPISEQACEQTLSLPINPFLNNAELDKTVLEIQKFFK